MSKIPNRLVDKGNRAEREITQAASKAGLHAKRAERSNGRNLGFGWGVDAIIADLTVQIKSRKRIAQYLKPNPGVDVQAIREDHGEWVYVVPARVFHRLLAERGEGLDQDVEDERCDRCGKPKQKFGRPKPGYCDSLNCDPLDPDGKFKVFV